MTHSHSEIHQQMRETHATSVRHVTWYVVKSRIFWTPYRTEKILGACCSPTSGPDGDVSNIKKNFFLTDLSLSTVPRSRKTCQSQNSSLGDNLDFEHCRLCTAANCAKHDIPHTGRSASDSVRRHSPVVLWWNMVIPVLRLNKHVLSR